MLKLCPIRKKNWLLVVFFFIFSLRNGTEQSRHGNLRFFFSEKGKWVSFLHFYFLRQARKLLVGIRRIENIVRVPFLSSNVCPKLHRGQIWLISSTPVSTPSLINANQNVQLTLLRSQKILTLLVFWGLKSGDPKPSQTSLKLGTICAEKTVVRLIEVHPLINIKIRF